MTLDKLIKSYLSKELIQDELSSNLISLCVNQSLQTLLYPVTNNKEYKKYYVSWVMKQEEFYKLQEEITFLLNSNNIKHLYFKGSVLSKLYDDSSVRTRGDIDVFIDNNDFNKAKDILLKNGYEIDKNIIDCMHHIAVKKNNIEVELHFNMFDEDVDKSWKKLYSEPYSKAVVVDGSMYQFEPTYHFLYCLMHFAHHLRHGAGLRYLLDFYYMFKKTNIDMNLLHSLLKQCKLEVLYSNVINALRLISEDFDNTIDNKDVSFFIDYMSKYGIHGNSNNETSNMSVHSNKSKYFVVRVFLLNNNYRLARYPKLGKWYFFPICLIYHWMYLLTHKIGSFFKFLFGKNKNKSLYKKLGV